MDKIAATISSPITLLYAFSLEFFSTQPTGPIFEISKNLKTIKVNINKLPISESEV